MSLLSQIENPVLSNFGTGGQDATPGFLAQLIAILWRTSLILGGLGVLIFIIMGAYNWLTAGDDKEKVAGARNRILNALIGMAILFIFIAFVSVIGPWLGFDLLNFELPTPGDSGGGALNTGGPPGPIDIQP